MSEGLTGRFRTGGVVEGTAIVSDVPFGFWHGIDPKTGSIINRRHPLYGEVLKDKIFVFPYGRGSTGNPGVFLEAVKNHVAPAAMINIASEPMIIACAVLAETCYGVQIPVVDGLNRNPIEAIRTGDFVRIDSRSGMIHVGRG
jgi:predicted aconitase with swiveling domain